MTKMCLTSDLQRRQQFYKKSGRPRFDWTGDNLKRICRKLYHESDIPSDIDQSDALKRDAANKKL